MWLGQQGRRGEVRRGEAWDGSLMRAGGGTAVDGVRGKRKRMTHCAQMTPREIKKRGGGLRSQTSSFTRGLSVLYVP